MADKNLKIIVDVDDKASAPLRKVSKSIDNISSSSKDGSLSFKAMSLAVAAGNAIWSIADRMITAVTRAISDNVKMSLAAVGQYKQSRAVLFALGNQYGWTAEKINETIEAIRAERKDIGTAIEVTKSLMIANIEAAKAVEAVTVARDLAATQNINSNAVLLALTQAVQQESAASLNSIGIHISLRKAMADYAEANNLSYATVQNHYRGQAILNAVLERGKDAVGAYEASMYTWNKQANSFRDGLGEVRIILGDLLDDAFLPIIKQVNDAIFEWREWAFVNGELNDELKQVADTIGTALLFAFEGLKFAGKGAIAVFEVFKNAISSLIRFLSGAVQVIAELLSWLNPFARHSPSLVEQVEAGTAKIVELYGDMSRKLEPKLSQFEGLLSDVTAELDLQKKALDEAEDVLNDYKEKVEDLTKALNDAEESLRSLRGVQLEGFGEMSDELFNVEQEIKKIKLDKTLAKLAGASEEEIDRLDEKLSKLELERDKIRLEWEVDTDPLYRQLNEMKNKFEGLDKEMNFDNLKTAIGEAQESVSKYRLELDNAKLAMDNQQQSVDTLRENYGILKEAADEMKNAVSQASSSLAGGGGGTEGESLQSSIEALYEPLAELKIRFQEMQKKVDDVKASFQNFRDKVGGAWGSIVGWLSEIGVIETFRLAWEKLVATYEEQLKPALDRLFKTLEPFMPLLSVLAIAIAVGLISALTLLISAFAEVVGILAVVIDKIASLMEWLGDKLSPAIDFVTGLFLNFAGAISGSVNWILKLIDKFSALKNLLSSGLSNPFSVLSNFGGAKATGGAVVANHSYLVGEKGAELFTPSQNGFIVPNNQLAGAGGGGNITINITGNTIANNLDVERIGDAIVRKLKLTRRV